MLFLSGLDFKISTDCQDALSSRSLLDFMLNMSTHVAQTEVVTALVQPQRQIITLLHNRSVDLAHLNEAVDLMAEEITNEDWGMF